MEVTLQDLLHAINILGEDRDVLVDGYGEFAVCPPLKLTPQGRERFNTALSAKVTVKYEKYDHIGTFVCGADEDEDDNIWNFLMCLGGNCSGAQFEIWFQGEQAKYI